MSCRAVCVDCLTVGTLSLCVQGVDCSAVGARFGLKDGIVGSGGTTFGITSSSIVVVCDVLSITRNGPTVFGNSFIRDWSAICSAAVSAVAGGLSYT